MNVHVVGLCTVIPSRLYLQIKNVTTTHIGTCPICGQLVPLLTTLFNLARKSQKDSTTTCSCLFNGNVSGDYFLLIFRLFHCLSKY